MRTEMFANWSSANTKGGTYDISSDVVHLYLALTHM